MQERMGVERFLVLHNSKLIGVWERKIVGYSSAIRARLTIVPIVPWPGAPTIGGPGVSRVSRHPPF